MLISFLHEVQAHWIPQGSHFNPWLPFWEQNAAAFLIQMELASSSKIFQAVSYQRTAKAARDEVNCGIVKIIGSGIFGDPIFSKTSLNHRPISTACGTCSPPGEEPKRNISLGLDRLDSFVVNVDMSFNMF